MRISNCLADSRRVAKACGNIRSLTNQMAYDFPLDFPGQIKETRITEAFVFEALRTPRGKGKKDGSLYGVKPVTLLSGLLRELQARHDFDTAEVEDVVGDALVDDGFRYGIDWVETDVRETRAGIRIVRWCRQRQDIKSKSNMRHRAQVQSMRFFWHSP